VLLISGIIVRVASGRDSVGSYATLRVALGLGYLIKSPMCLSWVWFTLASPGLWQRSRERLGGVSPERSPFFSSSVFLTSSRFREQSDDPPLVRTLASRTPIMSSELMIFLIGRGSFLVPDILGILMPRARL
jgi:hypothetical protein